MWLARCIAVAWFRCGCLNQTLLFFLLSMLTGMSLVIQMPNVQPRNVTAAQEMHDYLDSPNRCSGLLKDAAFVQHKWQTSKTLFRIL